MEAGWLWRRNMQKGNVLVIGNSGVGKSTLINAVLGDDRAETGWGTAGTTSELKIYENSNLPFRVIDSIGFEPSFLKRTRAIGAIQSGRAKVPGRMMGAHESMPFGTAWTVHLGSCSLSQFPPWLRQPECGSLYRLSLLLRNRTPRANKMRIFKWCTRHLPCRSAMRSISSTCCRL